MCDAIPKGTLQVSGKGERITKFGDAKTEQDRANAGKKVTSQVTTIIDELSDGQGKHRRHFVLQHFQKF